MTKMDDPSALYFKVFSHPANFQPGTQWHNSSKQQLRFCVY